MWTQNGLRPVTFDFNLSYKLEFSTVCLVNSDAENYFSRISFLV